MKEPICLATITFKAPYNMRGDAIAQRAHLEKSGFKVGWTEGVKDGDPYWELTVYSKGEG
jgi:hypothetical protein